MKVFKLLLVAFMIFAPILTSMDYAEAASYSRSRSSSMRTSGAIRSTSAATSSSTSARSSWTSRPWSTARPNTTRSYSNGSTARSSYSTASANTRMWNTGIGSRFWGGRWGWRGWGFWGFWFGTSLGFFNGLMLWSLMHPFGYPYMWFHAGVPYMGATMWYVWHAVPWFGGSVLMVLLLLIKISLFFWFAYLAYFKFATGRIRLGILFIVLSILAISF